MPEPEGDIKLLGAAEDDIGKPQRDIEEADKSERKLFLQLLSCICMIKKTMIKTKNSVL